jgi:hypothetical protein
MSNRIDFTDQEIRNIIEQHLTGPQRDLLSEAIFGLMGDSDWKKELLLKASLGIKPQSVHRLNEYYLVKTNSLSTYDMNETLTKEAGLISENDMFKCKLVEFLPWESAKYRLSYMYLKSDGSEYNRTYELGATELLLIEEFPEDFT